MLCVTLVIHTYCVKKITLPHKPIYIPLSDSSCKILDSYIILTEFSPMILCAYFYQEENHAMLTISMLIKSLRHEHCVSRLIDFWVGTHRSQNYNCACVVKIFFAGETERMCWLGTIQGIIPGKALSQGCGGKVVD